MLPATVITPWDQQVIYFATFTICQKIAFIFRIQRFLVQPKLEKGHIKHQSPPGTERERLKIIRYSARILSVDLLNAPILVSEFKFSTALREEDRQSSIGGSVTLRTDIDGRWRDRRSSLFICCDFVLQQLQHILIYR